MLPRLPTLFASQYTANGFYFLIIMWVGICLSKTFFLVKLEAKTYQVILLVQLEILLAKEVTHLCS